MRGHGFNRVGKFGVSSKESRTLDGVSFDSRAEMVRWAELKMLETSGLVSELQRQVAFEVIPSFLYCGKRERATVYRADFVYRKKGYEKLTIEDVKGCVTDTYKIKRKLVLLRYGEEYEFFENRVGGGGKAWLSTR